MTAHTYKKSASIALISAALVSILSFVLITYDKPETKSADLDKNVKAVINPLDLEIAKWQTLIKDHPTYRDAYIELAQLYSQKGDIAAARLLIKTAHNIDPFSEKVYEVGKVLGVSSF